MVVVDTFPLSKTITLVFSWMLFEWDFWKCVVVTCSKLYLCSYQFLVTLNHFQGHMRIWKIKDKKRQVGMFYPLRMSLNSCSCFSVVWNTIWLWIITQTWKMVLCSVESSVFRNLCWWWNFLWWWHFPGIWGFGGKIFDVSIPICTFFFNWDQLMHTNSTL